MRNGTKSLKTLGPEIWYHSPEDIKSEASIPNLRNILTLDSDLKVDVMYV